MDMFEQALRLLPDTVIITDVYWYILNFNQAAPFEGLRKGQRLTAFMPDCASLPRDRLSRNGKVYQRSVTPVYDHGLHVGYTAYLADITDRENLTEQLRRRSAELDAMTRQQARANEELEAYVRQAEQLSVYEEQLRIAHAIHDDAGHAVTALNTISRMCLQLRESDPERYQSLLDEGLALCEQASAERKKPRCSSLREMLEGLRAATTFPVELIVTGEEPPFAGALHEIIGKVCREAFNNTLAHSLADRLTVELAMTPEALSLHIRDNGCFRGPLEKGFGLTEMEENVHRTGGTVAFETEEGAGFGIRAEWSAE